MSMKIVVLGLSITSSWGNGHATTYRALVKALAARGHEVTFLERDVPWYRDHCDMPSAPYCRVVLYRALRELSALHRSLIAGADLVVLGSFVPDGAALADWMTTTAGGITAFYDIDTPVTLARLAAGDAGYISASLIPRFDLYLSFTGGPTLDLIRERYGSPCVRALYCSVDPELHAPLDVEPAWSLGYLGTYSEDRQPGLERLLLGPARRLPDRRFVLAGSQYPATVEWPSNVERIEHLPPGKHGAFYSGQRYTLNVTRADMKRAGFSPSVRLFEAAAAGVPVISDRWPGLETVFAPGKEILVAEAADDVVRILRDMPDERRREIADAARRRVLREHTAAHRARQLEQYCREVTDVPARRATIEAVA